MLLPSLAKKIVIEVRKLLDEDIIIVDTSGIIISSTDNSRLGNFHEGALLSIMERKNVIITKEMEITLKGVKAGINLPVFFQQKVVCVIGITGDPEKVSQYGELLKKMTELFVQESYYAEQIEWTSRALEAFVFDWLQDKTWTSEFYNRASILGINLNVDRQLILGSFDNLPTMTERELWNQLKQRQHTDKNNIYIRWGNNRFLFLLTPQKKHALLDYLKHLKTQMETNFSVNIYFGVGKAVKPNNVRESFNQADRALTVAQKTNSTIFEEDLKIEMLLQEVSEKTKREFVQRTIGKLTSEKDLIETLYAYIQENQSIKNTAELLHIHINTLHYRLKRIEELTNLNPKDFQSLVTLHLSLLLLEE
ncbi:CdaR family transcriptional regulator [Cytobacillus dafuensis]|uniref:Carbohydrate diacid regulator n=1 Tax=Cytobacillus dafuensis TaxID=1742359 RepID=A0A5B8Z442_CYTDA|nr:sugar diacid recognition domain-containing protein [Cytobacillus dafuensis]QED47658.1 carbohydrate diacid regulator [Cytobacillus dafuensis]